MKMKNPGFIMCSVVYLLFSGAAFSEADKVTSEEAGLHELNQQISSLSNQIVKRQEGLETDLDKLLEQRRALEQFERQIQGMIFDQENKLLTQRVAIQEAEKQLVTQKQAYLDQRNKLEELRISMGVKNEAEKMVAAE